MIYFRACPRWIEVLKNQHLSFLNLVILISLSCGAIWPASSWAQDFAPSSLQPQKPSEGSLLLAQSDPDEAYDPFTDYSEFDENSDEEADINFFKNGRFFTVGLVMGYRGFTENFAKTYKSAPTFGLFISYFFDLRLALSMGLQTGDHAVSFKSTSPYNTDYTGNVSITSFNFDLKYYLSTQNITRGLADLNPYIIGGLGQFSRTYTISGLDGYSRDSTMGINLGTGIEIPLMRKKAYLGLQGTYHYVNFADENKQFVQGSERLERTINGDIYDFLVILGMNF
ncbi:MAG: hypothetical protein ACOYOK_03915 [Pseudobdellovibrionaceae bacterium]